jgi:hypothetical protein
MRFEVSERIPTSRSAADILDALEQQFRKVSSSVRRVGSTFTATMIGSTFGSINRTDQTTVSLKRVDDGYLVVADVYYRPSVMFWVFLVCGLFGWVLWVVPIVFYLIHKNFVRKGIEECLQRVKNEFLQHPSFSRPVIVQAMAVPSPRPVAPQPAASNRAPSAAPPPLASNPVNQTPTTPTAFQAATVGMENVA